MQTNLSSALRRLLLLSVLLSDTLSAASQTLPLTVTPGLNSLEWSVANTSGTSPGMPFTGNCNDSVDGLGISEATSASGATDAYDNAWMLFVDNDVFFAPATVDVTGDLLTAGPVLLSGLNTSVEFLFPGGLQAARIRAIFSNPTASAITVAVDVPVNLGSDAGTLVEDTSTGDNVFSTADRWVITSDSTITTEPVVTTVIYGPGSPALVPQSVTRTVCVDSNSDSEGIGFSFTITVPANSTRSLMFFVGLGSIQGTGNLVTAAMTFVTMFDRNTSIDTRLLNDLTSTEQLQILNWDFAATTSTSSTSGTEEEEDRNFIDDFIGCSLGSRKTNDPSLLLLVLLALAGLARKKHHRTSTPLL